MVVGKNPSPLMKMTSVIWRQNTFNL